MPKEQSNRKKRSKKMLIILFIVEIWLMSLLALALIVSPNSSPNGSSIPEFEIKDRNGSWEAQGTVAVFNDMINPGNCGEYDFIISNLAGVKLKYSFVMEEVYTGTDEKWSSFMQYRLKMNGQHLETDVWFSADNLSYDGIIILPNTKQLMTLEWRWNFDGDDENDTTIGKQGGTYSVVFHLQAEVAE